jgi:hypothetical protein
VATRARECGDGGKCVPQAERAITHRVLTQGREGVHLAIDRVMDGDQCARLGEQQKQYAVDKCERFVERSGCATAPPCAARARARAAPRPHPPATACAGGRGTSPPRPATGRACLRARAVARAPAPQRPRLAPRTPWRARASAESPAAPASSASGNVNSSARRLVCPRAGTSERCGGASTKHQSAPCVRAVATASRHTAGWAGRPPAPAEHVQRDGLTTRRHEPRGQAVAGGRHVARAKPQARKQRHRDQVKHRARACGRATGTRHVGPPRRQRHLLPQVHDRRTFGEETRREQVAAHAGQRVHARGSGAGVAAGAPAVKRTSRRGGPTETSAGVGGRGGAPRTRTGRVRARRAQPARQTTPAARGVTHAGCVRARRAARRRRRCVRTRARRAACAVTADTGASPPTTTTRRSTTTPRSVTNGTSYAATLRALPPDPPCTHRRTNAADTRASHASSAAA